MKYNEITDWLFSQLPMFHRVGKSAYKADLETSMALDKHFGFPHRNFYSIHIAGTNGKGSVSNMLAAVLQEAGYKVGLYTSPHLVDFRERIRVNGEMIPKKEVISFVENNMALFSELKPSFFEMTVAMAFDYFSRQNIDVAVVEAGLGGRLDSTNIIDPVISVITNISYDHMDLLGNTLEKIAFEKAGIIKSGIPVVVGEKNRETRKVFDDKAAEVGAPIFFANDYFQVPWSILTQENRQYFQVMKGKKAAYPELYSDLIGLVQRKNLPVVLEVLELLKIRDWHITDDHIYEGLSSVKKLTEFAGRWEVIDNHPKTVVDTGHNIDGISQVVYQLENTRFKKLHLVYGTVSDKEIDQILQILPKTAAYYFTMASIPRALDVKVLAAKAAFYGLQGSIHNTVPEALAAARKSANTGDLVLVTGSTYVVAEALGH
ncbi:MAG: bifunctional folylpolyglutamate synthase/dihydrofolate synthase [Bacteroidales bacterium]|nr:bifunctional folylpolyglutamate synthase/dihydrofolate synthase [Bacteroidales bacterium]